MTQQWGATYRECFGTKRQQEWFYKNEFYKYLCTWGMRIDKGGRVALSIAVPHGAITRPGVRGAFLEAIKRIPRKRSGGRPKSVRPEEVPQLRAAVKEAFALEGKISLALRRVAEREGMDPRTLKTALGKVPSFAGCPGPAHTPAGSNEKVSEIAARESPPPSFRHYRRNTFGHFDEISRK